MIKKNINEELTKSDISKEITIYLSNQDFKNKIQKIVKEILKDNKELEDKFVQINKNVLIQLYKTLWTKKSFWVDSLKNKAN